MRTRAMACLRRPVAAPGAEAEGRRAASPVAASDSEVYSVSSTSSASTSVLFTVMSVTVSLLRNLRDFERDGLLRGVRVAVAGVDLQLGQLLASQGVLRDHAADGLLDRAGRVLLKQLGVARRPQTAREARVAVGLLLLQLGAGQRHLLRVDDDDEVTGVNVGGIGRLVLAAEQDRGLGREAAQHDVRGVDNVPGAGDLAGLRCVGTHV